MSVYGAMKQELTEELTADLQRFIRAEVKRQLAEATGQVNSAAPTRKTAQLAKE